jgi:hypothetical protein
MKQELSSNTRYQETDRVGNSPRRASNLSHLALTGPRIPVRPLPDPLQLTTEQETRKRWIDKVGAGFIMKNDCILAIY